jgi:hypothetical protein
VNRVFWLSLTLTAAGLAGYAVGVTTAYRGRAFSVTLLMVGIALLAMRRVFDPAEGPS